MRLALFLSTLTVMWAGEQDIRENAAFIYDVTTDRGPCVLTQKQYDSLGKLRQGLQEIQEAMGQNLAKQSAPGADKAALNIEASRLRSEWNRILSEQRRMESELFAKCSRPFQFRDVNGVSMVILHPRFRADYTVEIKSQRDRGPGTIEVRGLNDISPINLSALGTPVPHGGTPPSGVTVTPLTPAQVLTQLIDQTQMNQPQLTLLAQARDLANAAKVMERDRAELNTEIDRIRKGPKPGAESSVDCDSISGAPTIGNLQTCITRAKDQIMKDNQATLAHDPLRRYGCTAAEQAGYTWIPTEFECLISQIDQRIADLGMVRSRLNEYSFRAVADKIETESEALIAKLNILHQNVLVVRQARDDFEQLRKQPEQLRKKPGESTTNAQIFALRRADIKKQLKDKYGTVLEEAELNALADAQAEAFNSPAFQRQYETAINTSLKNTLEEFARYFSDPEPSRALTSPIADLPDLKKLRQDETDARTSVTNLNESVDALNQTFARTFEEINNVYLRYPDPSFIVRNIDLTTGAGSNRDIFAALKSDETFKPYRFTGVVPPAGQAPVAGPLIAATPNPQLTATPANLPQNINKSFDFEMHKFWHANIVAGFVFSSIAGLDFTTATQTVQQNGQAVTQSVAAYSKNQQPTAHYLLGFNYYLRSRDTYPKPKRSNKDRWMPGILGGVGLESTKNFFAGPNFEPVLGVDLSVGLHYGEQKALPLGTILNQTVLPGGNLPNPLSSVMKVGIYGMIGFDLNIFRRFLGAAAP